MPAPRSSKVTLTLGYLGSLLLCCIITGRRAGVKDGTDLNQTGSFYLAARPYQKKTALLFRAYSQPLVRPMRNPQPARAKHRFTGKNDGLTAPVIASYLDHRPPTTIKPVNPRLPPYSSKRQICFMKIVWCEKSRYSPAHLAAHSTGRKTI